jgi:hypothetical protein
MLSNTFSTIVTNATAEIQFRRAVQTLEGVKSDAIFAYQPPFNILAVFVLLPMKFVVSPRWFHKIHVATVRTINLPVLLIIAIAERRLLGPDSSVPGRRETRRGWLWEKWKITTHGDLKTVFEIEPPDSITEEIAVDDQLTHHMIRRQFLMRQQSSTHEVTAKPGHQDGDQGTSHKLRQGFRTPSRRDSIAPYGEGIIGEMEAGKNGGISERLNALEESVGRIEEMLGRLCDGADDGESLGEEEVEAGEMTGTVRDLDRSDEYKD